MITNKDIRVENGALIINGDPYPLDGQSPEAIMQIVEDNSDTTPTENSDAPITSGGVFTALAGKQDTLTFDTTPTASSSNPVTSDGIKTYLDNNLNMYNIALTPSFPTGFTAGTPYSAYLTKIAPHLAILSINIRFSAVAALSDYETFFTYADDITPTGLAGGSAGKLYAPDGSYIEVSCGFGKGVIKIYSENIKANSFYRGALPILID